MITYFIFLYLFCFHFVKTQLLDHTEVQCLVCGIVIEKIEEEISKIDPKKKISVGSYRVDHKGDRPNNEIEWRRSELFLTELMDTICIKMDDYVRAIIKSNRRLVIFPLVDEFSKMHPLMGKVDVIQDGDLNKSLKYYCEVMLGDHYDAFIKAFKEARSDEGVCVEISDDCPDLLLEKVSLEQDAINEPAPEGGDEAIPGMPPMDHEEL